MSSITMHKQAVNLREARVKLKVLEWKNAEYSENHLDVEGKYHFRSGILKGGAGDGEIRTWK